MPKLVFEIDVHRISGRSCDLDEIFDALRDEWDGLIFYPQSAESDAESGYEVTTIEWKP